MQYPHNTSRHNAHNATLSGWLLYPPTPPTCDAPILTWCKTEISFMKHMQSIFWNVDILTLRLVCYDCGHHSDIVDLVNCRPPRLDYLHNLDGCNRWIQSNQNKYSCYYFHYRLTGFDCVGFDRWADLGVSSCIAGRNWIACDIGWQMVLSVGAAKALLPILHQKHGSNKC